MKKAKQFRVFFLASLAAVFFSACGGGSSGGTGPQTVTLVTHRGAATAAEYWASDIWTAFQRQANVTAEYSFYELDRMSLMFASGDIADIVVAGQRFLPNVFDANLAMKLDPILESHIPNALLPMYRTRNEMLRLFLGGNDGGLYILSPGIGPENVGGQDTSTRGYGVRWDYYKAIGAPPINNNAQFIEAIRAMAEMFPVTPDGRRVYGVGIPNDFPQFYLLGMLTSNLNMWTFMGSQYMGDFITNELSNGYMDTSRSAYWDIIKVWNSLHQMGLFDPDSFTQTIDEYNAKQHAGVYVASHFRTDAMYFHMMASDPNTLAGFMLVPSPGTAVFANKPLVMGNAPDDSMFIFSRSRNWEAAARLVNVMHDPDIIRSVYSGFKGVHWDYDDNGQPLFFDEFITDYSIRTDEIIKLGVINPPRQWILADWTARHPDGYFFNLFYEPSFREKGIGLWPLYEDYSKFYGVAYPAAAMQRNVDNGSTIDMRYDFIQLISSGMTDVPRNIERIVLDLNEILYRALPRLITAENDAAYNAVQRQILGELTAAGEPEAWEWVRTNYNRYMDLARPIIQNHLAERDY